MPIHLFLIVVCFFFLFIVITFEPFPNFNNETIFSEEKVIPGIVVIFSIIYFAVAIVYYNEEK